MTPCLAGHWSGLEDFPVYIQDGGVDAVLDVFFHLVKALGDLLGAGAQGGDGPGGTVEGFLVGGFGDGEVGFSAQMAFMPVKALRLAFRSSQP